MDNKPNERTFHGGILMKKHPIIDGTVTVEGWKENLTCLQKILMIDKLIREYKKAFDELKAEYEKIAPILDDYDTIIERFNTIDGEIDDITHDIDDLKGRVTDCEDDITALDGRVDDLETAVSGITGDIGDLETLLAGKQDTLVSGTNIKTINGESILGSGNIVITGDTSSVFYRGATTVSGDNYQITLLDSKTIGDMYDDYSAGKNVYLTTSYGSYSSIKLQIVLSYGGAIDPYNINISGFGIEANHRLYSLDVWYVGEKELSRTDTSFKAWVDTVNMPS